MKSPLLVVLVLALLPLVQGGGGDGNSTLMNAVFASQKAAAGDFSHISMKKTSVPTCCSNTQLLIRTGASSINPVDWKLTEMGLPIVRYPHIPGFDSAGTVVKAGDKATFKVGDEVWLMTDNAYAEYVVSDSSKVRDDPTAFSFNVDSLTLYVICG